MTKTQSKKVRQLKYLLLIPLLGTMLLYTACSDENKSSEVIAEKELVTIYNSKDGEVTSVKGEKNTYLDRYFGEKINLGKELSISDLSEEEKNEFLGLKESLEDKQSVLGVKVYEGISDRKIVAYDLVKIKVEEMVNKGGSIPFSLLDKVPTFPGCVEGDKTCFNRSLQEFVQENFDTSIANGLGLDSGKKRLYVRFKIDKKGNVTDIKVRAPHPTLKLHVEELAQKLPQMQPGEKDGKIVATGFVLPITFNVE